MSARAEAKRKVKTMPASAETMPVTTKSQNLIRFTRTPAKCAASSLAPMAKIERPMPGAVQDDAEDHREHHEQDDRVRDLGAGERCRSPSR